MGLPIIEQPIYGQMTLETAAWSTPFSWVDRTADIVGGIAYAEGGRVGAPGQSQVDVGTLNTTFKDVATAPLVGDLIRLRRTGTTEYAFVGYVQDVSQRVVFDDSVSYTTPVVLTSINCLDWVGYISQFQFEGIGGASSGSVITTQALYDWVNRVNAIHLAIDPTNATTMIQHQYAAVEIPLSDTDLVGTISNHLDLIAATVPVYWYGQHTLPTNKTTGRDNLIFMRDLSTAPSSGKTFTDEVGTAGQLHYVELDQESSSANVANTIVANNRSLVRVLDKAITSVGGFNDENFMVINGVNTVGIGFDGIWKESDSTSITTYGNRQADITTNVGFQANVQNYVPNPSAEYSGDGYPSGTNTKVARRRPSDESTPFAAYHGEWAIRLRRRTSNASATIDYVGTEGDGIPVRPSRALFASAWAARGTPSRTDVRARIELTWYDSTDSVISTDVGAYVSLSTANTWYKLTESATSPANAEYVMFTINYTRSGGGTHNVNDRMWADALMLGESSPDYFDGDSQWDSSYVYLWTGGVGASPSLKANNYLDDSIVQTLARYATTGIQITRIRWNAQEDLTAVSAMHVGSTIQVRYNGTTTTHRIVGIDGNVSPERYMIDYYLTKV